MDRGQDKKPSKSPRDSKGKESLTPGNVAVDNRGRNIWNFHGESIDSTSVMLEKLDNPALALEPTRKTRQLGSGADAAAASGASAGKASAGKPAQAAAGKSPKGDRNSPAGKGDLGGTTQSFEQRYQVKPGGKNRGGGFDPYNRS